MIREDAKKVIFLIVRPPSSLVFTFLFDFFYFQAQVSFFLSGPAFYPSPPLMAGPLRKELFFATSLTLSEV